MFKKESKIFRVALVVYLMLTCIMVRAQVFDEIDTRALTEMNINYGNAVADYDLDGDLDVFIVAYNSFEANDETTFSRLLENKGGRFEDVTVAAGFGLQHSNNGQALKLGASWGDYDNDGYPDLLLAHQNGTQLYRNLGNKTFRDVTRNVNIEPCTSCNNSGSLWWDYDKDGDLDLYLNYLARSNRLYNNKGDGTFEEIDGALNLDDSNRTWSCLPIDANNDGWLDLYVVNDFGLSNFYISQEGQSFIDATEEYNLKNTGCGMGSTIGDYNNDGYFDIYVTNIAETKNNPLFMGTPDGPYINTTVKERVANGHYGWGTRFLDADNDGDQDLYIVNGDNDLHYNNVFFKNLRSEGQDEFQNWSQQSRADGGANGMGAEVFDYNNDGNLDILVSNTNDSPYLYKNATANPNKWLQVDLEGITSNRNAFGAKLTAYIGDNKVHRLVHGASIMGQSVKPVHFGLGKVEKIDSLVVYWPNTIQETVYDIAVNQKVKIVEQEGMQIGEKYVPQEESEPMGEEVLEKEELFLDVVPYPNPFQESITFRLDSKESGRLHLEVFSISGVKVFDLKQKIESSYDWSLHWKGENNAGLKLASGLYFYRINFANQNWSGKIILNN